MAVRIQRHHRLARSAVRLSLGLSLALCGGTGAFAATPGTTTPFAYVHQHYMWNQTEITSVADAVAALDANHIGLAVVTGPRPNWPWNWPTPHRTG